MTSYRLWVINHASLILATAALLVACQPQAAAPDAQSPTPQPVRLVSAEGAGSVTLEVAGQEIRVDVSTESRPDAEPCVRASATWGPLQVPWERGCGETDATLTPDADARR